MQFADVIVRTHDLGDVSVNTFNLCKRKFADDTYVPIRFQKDDGLNFLSNGIVIEKSHDTWACLVSTSSLDQPISYFEILVQDGRSCAIFIGITDNISQHIIQHGILAFNSCVIYNCDGDDTYDVLKAGSEKMLTGDVVGVVVDRERDTIRFYINGEFVGDGLAEPSDFDEIYAIVGLENKNAKVRVCNRYPYHSLDLTDGY
jgi:hypothetical protein